MDIMMLNAVGGLWGIIINWFNSWIGNFALAIIVFTIVLKLVLVPLDVWQKKTMRKNSQKQAILAPEVEKIKKKYAGNEQVINQKTMELYKKNDYNVVGSCFGLLINMVVTIVIFFTLFSSLGSVSSYMIKDEFNTLNTTFVNSYDSNIYSVEYNRILTENGSQYEIEFGDEFDNLTDEQKGEQTKQDYVKVKVQEKVKQEAYAIATNETNSQQAQKDVSNKYSEVKQSFLWIKNVWRPDTAVSVFPKTSKEFISLSGYKFEKKSTEIENYLSLDGVPQVEPNEDGKYFVDTYYQSVITKEYAFTEDRAKELFNDDYSVITGQLIKDNSGANGYYILIILSGLVIVASQLLANVGMKAKNKKGEEVKVGKNVNWIMLILLPLFMMYFTLKYTAVFSLYIVVSSIMSTIISYVLNLIMNKVEDKKDNKNDTSKKVSYSRY